MDPDVKARLAEMSATELHEKISDMMILWANVRSAQTASKWGRQGALSTAREIALLVGCWLHAKDKE